MARHLARAFVNGLYLFTPDGHCTKRFKLIFDSSRPFVLLQELLPAFLKDGVSPEALSLFSMRFRHGNSHVHDHQTEDIFWDTCNGIALGYDGKPIAVIGFVAHRHFVTIRQLQGVRAAEKALKMLRRERLLISLLMRLASEEEYSELRVISACDSFWYSKRSIAIDPDLVTESEEQEHRGRLGRRYDGSARGMRFKWNPACNTWSHQL